MATKVFMEALSPTMEEGRLLTWLKKEGDAVNEGDLLAEVETDKATMELVARGTGVLRKVLLGEGETTNVGTLIAVVAAEGEDIGTIVAAAGAAAGQAASGGAATAPPPAPAGVAPAPATPAPAAPAAAAQPPAAATQAPASTAPLQDGERLRASPLARRLAAEGGVELNGVRGSGPGGRIIKRDIEAALESGPEAADEPEAAAVQMPVMEGAAFRDIPLTQMRKTIAKRLTQSIGPIPHFFLTVEVDMTAAAALRKQVNEKLGSDGVKISPNDIVVKAVAASLRKHPWVNSAWTGDAIRQHDAVHIGIAVAVEDGLITPVVRNADRKGMAEISAEVKELAGRAREKKLKPEEYTGATFSISNLGMFGISEFTAVINPPEAAILAVGAVEDKVVAVNGEVVVRPRMRITLSCDHRVIDGATGAAFLQTLKRNLEEPLMMVV